MEIQDKIGVRDLRVYHAWQSQNALRTLYENHKGVESRNLVSLYVALTLKATYCGFQDTYYTTSKDICEYTHLSHDFVPKGLQLLAEDKLISVSDYRSEKGYMLGKVISLLDVPFFVPNRLQKTDSSFLDSSLYKVKTEYNNISSESKDSSVSEKKEISYDIKETPANSRESGNVIVSALWEQFGDIIQYADKLGVFSKPKIEEVDRGMKAPKYLLYAIQKMMLLAEGKFAETYAITDKKIPVSNWREKLYEALDNLKIMKEDMRVWPYDKKTLPKTLDTFLYNERSSFSWFVKCLETPITKKEEMIEEKYGDVVEDKHFAPFRPWFDYYFYEMDFEQELNFKRNIGELITEHRKLWDTYGQYYSKIGKWNQYLGGAQPDKFIAVFANYLMEKHFHAHEASVRPSSKAFAAFKTWLRMEYNLNLDMSKDQLQELKHKAEGSTVKPTVRTTMSALPGVADGVITFNKAMEESEQENKASGVFQNRGQQSQDTGI